MSARLIWQRGSAPGWFVAYPVPGDTRIKASVHRADGRADGTAAWLWNVRAGMSAEQMRSGAAHTKQAAADAATKAFEDLQR